jgi:hypothetical protein
MSVREAEVISRKVAADRVRKKERAFDPELVELENRLNESLGTRVHIERKDTGGKIVIDFFSADDLRAILDRVNSSGTPMAGANAMLDRHVAKQSISAAISEATPLSVGELSSSETPVDDRAPEEVQEDENTEDLYSMKNFSL